MNDEGTEVGPLGATRFAVVDTGELLPTDDGTSAVGNGALPAAIDDVGSHVDVADADVVVAVGESALSTVAHTVDVPILAVDVEGPVSVPRREAADAVRALATEPVETTTHPLLTVESGSERSHAVFDVTLVTAEPARISEYSVRSAGREVDRFRADGVVVATQLGSHGYARAAGGPVLAVDADSFVTVPIAPFAIGADHWVLPSAETSLSVEREEAPVDCFADADRVGAATPGEPVHVRPDGAFQVVRPPGE